MVGRKIGSYAIKRLIGEGGMGSVFEAVQEPTGRRVAIKILRPDCAHQPDLVKRFFNEARATNLITHPSIVQISDYGHLEDRTAYLVMELLLGQPLGEHIEKNGGKLPEPLAQHLVWQLASVLAVAHARDIIHRDLKPSNVMLVADPVMQYGLRVKLLDFGIAKLGAMITRSPKLTRPGLVMGTPLYMAPEQCLGSATVNAKADVYSMGVLFFEMLTGQPPFTAESDLVVLNMHVTRPAPAVHVFVPTVSPGTASMVAKMLEKDPTKRPSMTEVTQMLRPPGSSRSREQDTMILAKKRRVGEPGGAAAEPDKTEWIHRSPKASQPMPVQRQQRLWALGVLLLVASGWIGFGVVRTVQSRGVVAALPAAAVPTPVAAPEVVPSPPTGHPATEVPSSAAPVSISIKSSPGGATVIDLEGEKKLGITPWTASMDARDRDLWLILRKEGYGERVIRVSLRHNSEWSEKLVRESGAPHRPATRATIEEMKKKYDSAARANAGPRIVD